MFKFFKKGIKMAVTVKVTNENESGLPSYQTAGSAGVDLLSNEDVMVKVGIPTLVDTGMRIQIPDGYELQIRSRSGLASKNGIVVMNSPGTIDSDYRGPVKCILFNMSGNDFAVSKGMRIAQGVLAKVERIEWQQVEQLDETERGENGFGSTKLS